MPPEHEQALEELSVAHNAAEDLVAELDDVRAELRQVALRAHEKGVL